MYISMGSSEGTHARKMQEIWYTATTNLVRIVCEHALNRLIYSMLVVKICYAGSEQVWWQNHCLEIICMLMYIISCLMRYIYCRRGCSETPLPVYVLEKSFWLVFKRKRFNSTTQWIHWAVCPQCIIVLRRKSSRVYITHDSEKRELGTLSWFFTTTVYDAEKRIDAIRIIICLFV